MACEPLLLCSHLCTKHSPIMLYFHVLHGACQGSGKTFTMSGREDVLELEEYEGVPLCRFPALHQRSCIWGPSKHTTPLVVSQPSLLNCCTKSASASWV